MRFVRRARWIAGTVPLALLFAGARVAEAQQSTITGQITERVGGAPVSDVQVIVLNTNLGALTNAEGRYTIRGVPAGAQQVRAIRIGYQEQKKPVTVTAGQSATVDFALDKTVVELAPVVTTATGETRRVEIGNAVSNISVAKLTETAPVTSVQDVLNSRAPGVAVTPGTQTGSGARIRIRGINSISLSNDPIYVIDGVRMTSNVNSSNLFTGGAQPSRTGDINPDEIESIEVVKGPSAATLYGTDAANGVVVITTKRGRAGAARWNVYAEGGVLKDYHDYPLNYTIWGKQAGATTTAPLNFCNNSRVSLGQCTLDSVTTFSPFQRSDLTPIGLGNRRQGALQVSGGSDVVRYFVSGEREDETGVFRLPDFERLRMDTMNIPIHDYTERPNVLGRTSVRANLNAAILPTLDVAVSTNFINIDQRFSNESNATAGIGSQVFGGPGFENNGTVGSPAPPTPLHDYRAWTPGYTWQEKLEQATNRYIASLNANWRPTSWWQNRVNVGNDLSDRVDDNLLLRGEGPPLTATYRQGFADNTRTNLRNFTAELASTITATPKTWLNLKTTGGVQYVNYKLDLGEATGTNLAPGGQTANTGASQNGTEATTLQKTLGLYVEEAASLRDRLFLTGAVRTDQNSAFGTNFQRVFYPKASLSWILSDESFFPRMGWMNSFRLRAAYGASGVQPGPNDALRSFSSAIANLKGADQPSVVVSTLGNKDLKPERSTEFETGFESKHFNNRLSLDFTYYRKRTRDALIAAIVPPSVGSALTVRRNLGGISNQGFELSSNAQILDTRPIAFDLTLNGSINSNKVVSLGGTPPQIGVETRIVEGYPIRGFWAAPIRGWEDKNHDGILTHSADPNLNEVFVDSVPIFRGYSQPRYFLTATPGFDLLNRKVRLQGLFDYRGGNKWYNNTERIRCVSRQNCNGLMNPQASFEEQAMVVATRDDPTKTLDGFFQSGAFVKLRELSAQVSLPTTLASRIHARSISLVGTARNIHTWTKYRGVDPESDYTATTGGDTPSEFQTLAAPTYFIFRVNLGF